MGNMNKDLKSNAIAETARSAQDVGSPEVQVSLLTSRINTLAGHMKNNKHDFHSRRGLLQMVGKRKKLLSYLKEKDFPSYQNVISKLGLRK